MDATTMLAVRAHRRGGPGVLHVEETPKPSARDDEVLVAVHAAGVTYDELSWDLSWTHRDGSDRIPMTPAHEFSGVVATADRDGAWRTGDEVYGLVPFDRDGAAAEFVAVPSGDIAAKPTTLTHVEAAAVPLAALTAWQSLVDQADVHPGEQVLVLGGAGAVGAFAVQVAAMLGAEVTATAQSGQRERLTALGADHVLDYAQTPLAALVATTDVAVDAVGLADVGPLLRTVRPGGRLVTLNAPAPATLVDGSDVRALFFLVRADQEQLGALGKLLDEGQLQVTVSRALPLGAASAAYTRPEGGAVGKTVLTVDAAWADGS